VTHAHDIRQGYRSLLQKSPIKETILQKRPIILRKKNESHMTHELMSVTHEFTKYHACSRIANTNRDFDRVWTHTWSMCT